MLVLSRKVDEKITIQVPNMPDIEIMIVSTGIKTRVGISAPREYQVVRNELLGTPNGEPKAVS
tara:strand:- start:4219 stop:4407 length:189 start_codon:yes stop_codon:yes gene_type:complete